MTPEQIPLLIGFIVMSLGSVAIFLHGDKRREQRVGEQLRQRAARVGLGHEEPAGELAGEGLERRGVRALLERARVQVALRDLEHERADVGAGEGALEREQLEEAPLVPAEEGSRS